MMSMTGGAQETETVDTAITEGLDASGVADDAQDIADGDQDQAAADAGRPAPLATIPLSVQADPLPDPSTPGGRSRFIEEVVVTAQKREENLQDVPISVTAFSAELLDAKGVLNAQDLPLVTPGLTLSTSVNFLTVFIRGIGSDAFLVADPSVANYVDGIYMPFSNGAIQDFGAIDRIEVLKGPQGTLFGRNAVGGAINVITKAPSLSETEISFQSAYSRYETTSNRLHVSVPLISEHLALSASGIYNEGNNYIDGLANGQPLQKDRTNGGRVKLRWAPAEWLDLTLAHLDLETRGAGSDYAPNARPSVLGRALLIQPQDPYAGSSNEDIFFRSRNKTTYGQLNLFPGAVDVRVLGGHQDVKSYSNYDFDGSPLPLLFFQIEPGAAKVDSAEVQILSNSDTWAASRLSWIVGAYYFHSIAGFSKAFARAAETDLDAGRVLGVQLPANLVEAVKDALDGAPVPSGLVDLVGTLETNSDSLFAQATLHVTDWMAVTAGGRYQEDERFIIESSAGLRTFNGTVVHTQKYSAETNSRWRDKHSSFKPKVSLDFRPGSWLGQDALLYVSWQQAIKGSAYNVVNIIDPPDYVKAEELEAYEVGLKTRLLGGLVSLNAAAFHYDLKNPQVQFLSVLKGGVVAFENAGSARVRGFEFDTVMQLFPSLTDGLVLTAAATFLDPVYTDYENGSGFDPVTGILRNGFDFTGNQIVRSPKFSGTTTLSQTFFMDSGSFEIAADYFYTSKIHYLAQNSDFGAQDPYGVIGARVSYLYAPWNARVTVFGKNIGNERYSNSIFTTDFGRNEARAPLAIYGIRLNWDF